MRGAEIRTYRSNNSSTNRENGEEKRENGTTTSSPTKITRTRIFVGDLGKAVTAEDLRNIFSSLGKVESVEIVRTQGRSFAYFDFLPSSPKSLSNLFSMYNGCKWKGGRLRLEKAKEHYLLRMRHERAEDAKLSGKEPSPPEELNTTLNPEKTEIQLFFPKLRKVKALPFKGTGKHKYSFQRVELPTLPIYFCDCEEHSDLSHFAKGKDVLELEAQNGGLDKKELDMMNSAMNKLFEREYIPNNACEGAGFVKEGDNAKSVDDMFSFGNETDDMTCNGTQTIDDLVAGQNETDNITDEDNLIINMVAGEKKETDLAYIAECHDQNMVKNVNLESESNWIEKSKEHGVAQPSKPIAAATQYARGASWLQKSSWTQLVSEKNRSFSISQLLPSATLEKLEQVEPKSTANSTGTTYCKLVKSGTSALTENSSKDSKWSL